MKRPTLSDFATSKSEPGTESNSDRDEKPTVTFAVGRDEPCATCGSRTDRQWRTDAGFVCPGCVEW